MFLSRLIFVFTLFAGLLLATSCTGQGNPVSTPILQENPAATKIHPVLNPSLAVFLGNDPYFVNSADTVSKSGPVSITRNIVQDRRGDFWFATWQGVIRYDGQGFINHTLRDGLIPFHTFSVMEDRSGNLWFGTIRGGLYRFDGQSYTHFTTANGLVDNLIGCMAETADGSLWFGTDGGVSRLQGNTFTNYTTADGLAGNSVNSIAQDKTGKIWIGTRSGVSQMDPNAKVEPGGKLFSNFTHTNGADFINVRSILPDKSGVIWIGGQEGLYRYDGKQLEEVRKNFIGYIFEDSKGMLWLSEGQPTDRKMTLTRYDGRSFVPITSDDQVFGITEDREHRIWFGTVRGVFRYDGLQDPVRF